MPIIPVLRMPGEQKDCSKLEAGAGVGRGWWWRKDSEFQAGQGHNVTTYLKTKTKITTKSEQNKTESRKQGNNLDSLVPVFLSCLLRSVTYRDREEHTRRSQVTVV